MYQRKHPFRKWVQTWLVLSKEQSHERSQIASHERIGHWSSPLLSSHSNELNHTFWFSSKMIFFYLSWLHDCTLLVLHEVIDGEFLRIFHSGVHYFPSLQYTYFRAFFMNSPGISNGDLLSFLLAGEHFWFPSFAEYVLSSILYWVVYVMLFRPFITEIYGVWIISWKRIQSGFPFLA